MSGTRSPSRKAPATEPGAGGRWPVWKLALLLWPAVTATVAINLFMAALMLRVLGGTPLGPVAALLWSLPLGIPASWLAGRWLRRLLDEAES
ncbi:MAG: hypothetical protein HW564_07895 [Ruegeria pomeroyi]|uniref:NnrT protein n=1 Tax=Ruegeria pomeroyi TaxID=89184 RepID=A0A850LH82_9RHOB|nr:hypothetical protein [Ruegeria pomeroyi]NVK96835.1 hypothetical protein [Ruegeria pomeroyi]NVL02503.1 hypothetical protein [Ruegeria pomeroyi]HCE71640.1 hypothetical protein [Ruegeria sp.]